MGWGGEGEGGGRAGESSLCAAPSEMAALRLHGGVAPQLSGRVSATQLPLQASSAQQQYIAVLQSRFVRRRARRRGLPTTGTFAKSARPFSAVATAVGKAAIKAAVATGGDDGRGGGDGHGGGSGTGTAAAAAMGKVAATEAAAVTGMAAAAAAMQKAISAEAAAATGTAAAEAGAAMVWSGEEGGGGRGGGDERGRGGSGGGGSGGGDGHHSNQGDDCICTRSQLQTMSSPFFFYSPSCATAAPPCIPPPGLEPRSLGRGPSILTS